MLRIFRRLYFRKTFAPKPHDRAGFIDRAETKSNGTVSATVSILSTKEAKSVFDADLLLRGIQPLWIEIVNDSDLDYYFLPIKLDPDYLSPFEAARRCHSLLARWVNRAIDRFFRSQAMSFDIPAKSSTSGFVFTNRDEDHKLVSIELFSLNKLCKFFFILDIPGFRPDYLRVDVDKLYSSAEIEVCDDEVVLRKNLEELPAYTLGGDQKSPGDPLNVILLGSDDDIMAAFMHRGWDETETTYLRSAVRTVRSLIFRSRYRHSPVSNLYTFGRHQDIAMQKSRNTVALRNHMRYWRAPISHRGMNVYVGQISRDIGLRLTIKTLITHKIDPEVDEAREYLIQDLCVSQGVSKIGFVKGVGSALPDDPKRNYTGDAYFTDGLRAVMFFSSQPTPLDQLELLDWEQPPPNWP